MKKIWKFLIVIVLLFFTIGCKDDDTNDNKDDDNQQIIPEEVVDLSKVQEVANTMIMPSEINTNKIELQKSYTKDNITLEIRWRISDSTIIDYFGNVTRSNEDHLVTLKAFFTYNEFEYVKSYDVKVLKYTDLERLNNEIVNFNLPSVIVDSYVLPTSVIDKDIIVEWESSDPEIIDQNGTKNLPIEGKDIVLKLILSLNNDKLEKEFNMQAIKSKELLHGNDSTAVHNQNDFKNGIFVDLELNENNCLVMNKLQGMYLSPTYQTNGFIEIVGSWSAITSLDTGTVELQYRVLVEGEWSNYVSYGSWRLGAKNYSKTSTTNDGLLEIDLDIIQVLNNKKASAYQYRVLFEREEGQKSPELLCVGSALDLGLSDVEVGNVRESVIYDVPQLNQNIVPGIGNSICSPTSITMLLKYKGHSFIENDSEFEHRYIAGVVFDSKARLYGNWTFNVAVMGAYGEYAFVKRFTGVNDLINHLNQVGPVALSVKGNMQGYYTTGGHLLVCKGYKIVDGEYIFICNDPNIKNVEIEYTYETIKNVWRNIAYCVE